jgi:hypothetical protein
MLNLDSLANCGGDNTLAQTAIYLKNYIHILHI